MCKAPPLISKELRGSKNCFVSGYSNDISTFTLFKSCVIISSCNWVDTQFDIFCFPALT